MPIPKPKDDENQDEFIERCMGDDTMQEEYPDNDQRLAVCYDAWRKDKEEDSCDMNIERRAFPVEMRVEGDEEPKIKGHAAVFNKLSDDLGGFKEIIEPGFFESALSRSDTAALWNHNPDIVLGRKSSKTLTLSEDDDGLNYEIDPPSWASGYIETIKRGDVTKSSFAFTVKPNGERWEDKDGIKIRHLLKGGCAALYDVSPVTYPAYPQTNVKVRMADTDKEDIIKGVGRYFEHPAEPDSEGAGDEERGRVAGLELKRKRIKIAEL